MSYSFGAKAATKAELEIIVRDELAKVPQFQPVHEADVDQAFNATKSLIDLMPDDPGRDIGCSVSGSIYKIDAGIELLSLSINVGMQARAKPE